MFTNKITVTTFGKFTFLVWVKSVITILFGIFLYDATNRIFNSGAIIFPFEDVIFIIVVSFIITAPFFVLMLTVVHFINRMNWSIKKQKFIIFLIYSLPIIILVMVLGVYNFEAILFVLLILIVPAVMIFFTTLPPSNTQHADVTEREDLIDDISFED